jgi:hypothetical protein
VTNRRQLALLAALLVVLAALLWFDWPQMLAGSGAGTSPPRGTTARAPTDPTPPRTVADVGLAALDAPAPAPVDSGRNPFRFAPRARPIDDSGGGPAIPPPVMEPPPPRVPSGPPPIPLRFIGLVDAPGAQSPRLAVLSDGRNVFHGREGDIIDGRYRIVRIGVESIEMSYVDGRGRQTIRLSGSG